MVSGLPQSKWTPHAPTHSLTHTLTFTCLVYHAAVWIAFRPMALMLLCEFILNSTQAPPGEEFLYHTLLELHLMGDGDQPPQLPQTAPTDPSTEPPTDVASPPVQDAGATTSSAADSSQQV